MALRTCITCNQDARTLPDGKLEHTNERVAFMYGSPHPVTPLATVSPLVVHTTTAVERIEDGRVIVRCLCRWWAVRETPEACADAYLAHK